MFHNNTNSGNADFKVFVSTIYVADYIVDITNITTNAVTLIFFGPFSHIFIMGNTATNTTRLTLILLAGISTNIVL